MVNQQLHCFFFCEMFCQLTEEILWLRSTMACIKHVVTWIAKKKRETLKTQQNLKLGQWLNFKLFGITHLV